MLLAFIKKGFTREAAFKLAQNAAMQTWAVKHVGRDDAKIIEQLNATPEVDKHFRKGKSHALCSLSFHIKNVNNRFRRPGL